MIKKINTILFVAIGAIVLLKVVIDAMEGLAGAEQEKATHLRSTRNADFAPTIFYVYSETLAEENPLTKRNGPVLDIARAIFPKARFVQIADSYEQIAELLRKNPHTAGFCYSGDERFADFAVAPTPLFHDELVIYSKRDKKWNYNGPESLDQIRLCVSEEFLLSPMLKQHAERNREHPERVHISRLGDNSMKNAFEDYGEGRLDAYVDSYVGMVPYRQGFKADDIISTVTSDVIDRLPVAFVVSNADPEYAKRLVDAYEREFAELKASGELRRLFQYYGITQ